MEKGKEMQRLKRTHLLWRQNGDGGFGRNGQMVVVVGFGILLPFQRAPESLKFAVLVA